MFRKIEDVIRSKPQTAETARADWQGETARAKFEGAAQADKARVTFGRAVKGVR